MLLRRLVLTLGKKKNPSFELDPSVSEGVLFGFMTDKAIAWLRGLKYFRAQRGLLLLPAGVPASAELHRHISVRRYS